MKRILYLFILFGVLGCSPDSKDLILGKWKMTSLIRLEHNVELINSPSLPDYLIDFRNDSVTIKRSTDSTEEFFTFRWFIQNDTLRIDTLEPFFKPFRVKQLDDHKMILLTQERTFFQPGEPFKDEEITLTKLN